MKQSVHIHILAFLKASVFNHYCWYIFKVKLQLGRVLGILALNLQINIENEV